MQAWCDSPVVSRPGGCIAACAAVLLDTSVDVRIDAAALEWCALCCQAQNVQLNGSSCPAQLCMRTRSAAIMQEQLEAADRQFPVDAAIAARHPALRCPVKSGAPQFVVDLRNHSDAIVFYGVGVAFRRPVASHVMGMTQMVMSRFPMMARHQEVMQGLGSVAMALSLTMQVRRGRRLRRRTAGGSVSLSCSRAAKPAQERARARARPARRRSMGCHCCAIPCMDR